MKHYSLTLVALLVIITSTSCHKKQSCVCTVRNITTNDIIDTRDFSYRGSDSRSDEEKRTDCNQTGDQIDEQNNNETTTECIVS